MRITEIHIEQFGAWKNLHLPLPQAGLSVLYGPNGAGKSTLLKFIRGLLYGFPPQSGNRPDEAAGPLLGRMGGGSWAGALKLEFEGESCELRRISEPSGRGTVEVSGIKSVPGEPPALNRLLQGVDEHLFEHVFAVGLREIQELGALQDGEVADQIYGLTLGPDGQRLLHAGARLRGERLRLADPTQKSGELLALFERYDRLGAELRAADKRPHYRELAAARAKLEAELEDIGHRQAGIQSQLRGHLLLQRAWGPWNRVRECTTELARLSVVKNFPEHGLERLDKLERELAEVAAARDALQSQAKQLRQKAARLSLDPEMRTHAASIQALLDQRDWIRQVQEQATGLQTQADALKTDLDARLEQLGPAWTPKRLDTVDVSPAGHFRLAQLARSFRAALARRAKSQRAGRRLEAAAAEQTEAVQSRLQELGGGSTAELLVKARRQWGELEGLEGMRLHEAELLQRHAGLDEQRERWESRLVLPPWVYLVLGFFSLAGLALVGLGFVTGVQTSGLVGAIYAFLGLTCSGLCWALKTHFERDVHERVEQFDAQAAAGLVELRQTRDEIAAATDAALKSLSREGAQPGELAGPDLMHLLTQQIADLEALTRDEQSLQRTRRKLEQCLQHLQLCEREVGTARQSWQEWLAQLGFAQNLRIEEAFEHWRALVEAVELRRQREALLKELTQLRWIVQAHQQRIEALGRRLERFDLDYQQPGEVLRVWEEQLRTFAANRKERRQLRAEAKARVREASEYQASAQDLKTQRAALLVQGGAADRTEFESRAESASRRVFLEDQHADAQRDLELAARSDCDLAVSEEDLRAFNAKENSECIEMLNLELEDLARDLREGAQRLGSLREEIQAVENNRASTQLRWEREQVAAALQQAAEQWLVLEVAGQTLNGLRTNFERTCQPVTLADASRYLTRLTCGKYRNVWTPLGERHLYVDDDQNHSLPVEHLSRGSREQLFLAIRLALVQEFARQGTALPMILDDVLVNFDQHRSEAAVDVLREFAERGHQVLLFTSHLHLARLFEDRGVEPIWLAGSRPNAAVESGSVERRAG
jgi:uncharacterized protein YhaN